MADLFALVFECQATPNRNYSFTRVHIPALRGVTFCCPQAEVECVDARAFIQAAELHRVEYTFEKDVGEDSLASGSSLLKPAGTLRLSVADAESARAFLLNPSGDREQAWAKKMLLCARYALQD